MSETGAQPMWVVDNDDVIRFVSPAAITALGYDGADGLLGCHRDLGADLTPVGW
jgi:PAS domain-containing protein